MLGSAPVDGFRLAYGRSGSGAPAVLLHGWPGDHRDWKAVRELLGNSTDVVAPDLRGFGESDKHARDPRDCYSATAQGDSVLGLIEELGLERPVIAGYDVGSRVAQQLARAAPQLVRAIVVAPPLPGVGDRVLGERAQRESRRRTLLTARGGGEIRRGDPCRARGLTRRSPPGMLDRSDDRRPKH